jgi:hypothetical protein
MATTGLRKPRGSSSGCWGRHPVVLVLGFISDYENEDDDEDD